jgi:hypothetical protein
VDTTANRALGGMSAAERALELHNGAPGTVVLYDLVEWVSETIVEPLQAELDRAQTSASDAELAAALTSVSTPATPRLSVLRRSTSSGG